MNKINRVLLFICLLFAITLISGCKKTYTITYDTNGGKFLNGETIYEDSYKKGEELTILTKTPVKEGDSFVGWKYNDKIYSPKEKVVVKSNVTFKAVWANEEGYVSVTYKTGDGKFFDGSQEFISTYKKGDTVSLISEAPIIDNATFNGWINEQTQEFVENNFVINSNIVLIASYGEPLIEITYNAVTGEFSDGTNKKVLKVELNSIFQYIDTPTNGERLFNGWYDVDTDELIQPGSIVTKSMEVKAKYKRPGNEYAIKLETNGGLLDSDNIVTYYSGINYILPIPTKEGFEFIGWFDNKDFSGEKTIYLPENEEGNKEFFASWKLVDTNYAKTIFDELVPESTSTDLYFPTSYQGVSLYFTSSNTEILTVKGVIDPTHKKEVVTIECQIGINGEYFTYSKDVTVNAIIFEDMTNPVAGYFYNINIATKTDITLEQLDIVYYAFAQVSDSGNVTVQASSQLTKLMNDALELRKNNSMRFVLSIAGGAANFSAACRKVGTAKLANNIIDLVLQYNMDGVDIDWEFPSDSVDTENMYQLCAELRTKLDLLADGTGSPYLVTAAIPSHSSYAKFNLKKLNNVLDYVNMMSYDMNLEGRATHLCPLHKSKYDSGQYGVSLGVEYFTKAGLDANKIIIGAAFYGKAYKVTGTDMWPGLYPALGAMAELYNLQLGSSATVFYKYIYRNILTNDKYKRYYDTIAQVPYLYNEEEKIFITYEDEESLNAKVDYAYANGFGIMFWEYGYDYNNILTDAICNRVAQQKAGTIE